MSGGEAKEYISISGYGKNIFFAQLQPGDVLLYLYELEVEKATAYLEFIRNGLKNKACTLYTTLDKEDKLNFSTPIFQNYIPNKLHIISAKESPKKSTNALLSSLKTKLSLLFNYAESNNALLCVLTDFHTLPNHRIKKIARYIIKKSKEIKLTAITAHAVTGEESTELIKIHQNVAFSTKKENGISFWRDRPLTSPLFETVSLHTIEKLIKNNLENLTLFLLSQQPMCGYDLIKTIAQRFHVFLSQGTVYPLLYTLTSEGLLKVRNTAKEKVYYPAKDAKKTIQKRLEEFTRAQELLLGTFSGY